MPEVKDQLIATLSALKGPMQGVLVSRTAVRMNKKDVATKSIPNPFIAVYKIAKTRIEVNGDYEGKVNDNRMLEGKERTFEAGSLQWGTAVNNVIVEKDGQRYIKFIQLETDRDPTYVDENGHPVDYEALKQFLPNYNPPKKQGLETPVDVRTYKLDNVVSLSLNGRQIYHA